MLHKIGSGAKINSLGTLDRIYRVF
jgi:hypothetical protein